MVGTVSRRTVRMAVAIVARQQALERVDEVVVAACPGFDDRDSGGGVWDENVAETVAVGCAEVTHIVGEIDDAATRGVNVEDCRIHHSTLRIAAIARLCAKEEPYERTGGATGALPRGRGGGSCTHVLPLFKRNPRQSTPALRIFAMR
jgi:hypothetical protein